MGEALDDVLAQQERRRMSDQPGLGELGRGLKDLKEDVKALSDLVAELPDKFAAQAISRERYTADETRRGIELQNLTKRIDQIDAWKQGAFKRATAIVAICVACAGVAATLIAAWIHR
jgi:anti-sigma-K factor RskA